MDYAVYMKHVAASHPWSTRSLALRFSRDIMSEVKNWLCPELILAIDYTGSSHPEMVVDTWLPREYFPFMTYVFLFYT